MSGFPTREARGSFGPTRQDSEPAPDERFALSARFVNLEQWQIAGAGLCVPKAWFLYNGSTEAFLAGQQAWNAGGGDVPPTDSKGATGRYTFTFPSTVLDQDGNSVSPGLSAALALPQQLPATGLAYGQAVVTGGNVIDVRTYDLIGTADADVTFLVVAW